MAEIASRQLVQGAMRAHLPGIVDAHYAYPEGSRHARHRVSPSASPMAGSSGYPVRCGLSIPPQVSLEYWIIRFRG
jgi:hypothetical protein